MYEWCVYSYYYGLIFFKQKTAYEMRISDWSSDVCSSDLPRITRRHALHHRDLCRETQHDVGGRQIVADEMAARTEPAFHIGEMRIELLRDPRLDRRRRRAESRGVDAQQDRRHCRPLRKIPPFEVADIIVGAARGYKTAPAVPLAQIFGDRPRFDDNAPLVLDRKSNRLNSSH